MVLKDSSPIIAGAQRSLDIDRRIIFKSFVYSFVYMKAGSAFKGLSF